VLERDMSFINTISDIVTVLCCAVLCEGSVLAQGTLAQRVETAVDLLKKVCADWRQVLWNQAAVQPRIWAM